MTEKLILWDIDGTLLKISRQGAISLHLEVAKNLGSSLSSIPFEASGMTDSDVIGRLLELSGLGRDFGMMELALDQLDILSEKLENQTNFEILPGVSDMLARLRLNSWRNGVLTGNSMRRALSKINKSDLSSFFDSRFIFTCNPGESRQDIAIRVHKNLNKLQITTVIIIGDTPADIEIARKVGFQVVAVASGKFSSDELGRYQPDLLINGLESSSEVLEFIQSQGNLI